MKESLALMIRKKGADSEKDFFLLSPPFDQGGCEGSSIIRVESSLSVEKGELFEFADLVFLQDRRYLR